MIHSEKAGTRTETIMVKRRSRILPNANPLVQPFQSNTQAFIKPIALTKPFFISRSVNLFNEHVRT